MRLPALRRWVVTAHLCFLKLLQTTRSSAKGVKLRPPYSRNTCTTQQKRKQATYIRLAFLRTFYHLGHFMNTRSIMSIFTPAKRIVSDYGDPNIHDDHTSSDSVRSRYFSVRSVVGGFIIGGMSMYALYRCYKYFVVSSERKREVRRHERKVLEMVHEDFLNKKGEIVSELCEMTKFSPRQLESIYDAFVEQNGLQNETRGVMTHDNFSRVYNSLGVSSGRVIESVFRFWDRNHDGEIDFVEFVEALDVLWNGTFEQKAQMSFSTHDLDHNGYIDQHEFEEVVRAFSHGAVNTEEVHKFFRSADKSHDHRVSFDEFRTFIMSYEYRHMSAEANVEAFILRFMAKFGIVESSSQ